MAGGLIELISYGAEDSYLTGTPQITFFKAVFRRYTNFAIESIVQRFHGDDTDFGKTLHATIEKNADLIHKMYLVFELPNVQLSLDTIDPSYNPVNTESIAFQTASDEYDIVDTFTTYNVLLYRTAIQNIQAHNPDSINTATQSILVLVEFYDPSSAIRNNFKNVLLKYANQNNNMAQFIYDKTFIVNILNNLATLALTITNFNNIDLSQIVTDSMQNNNIIHEEFFCRKQQALQQMLLVNDNLTESGIQLFPKFAWVSRLGHSIFEYIDIEIGGQRIDRQYSDWMNIWWEVSHNEFQTNNYMKMIGNVCELTTFNSCAKPKYTLTIPLQFWFCKYAGLALPLISLNFFDVVFKVKIRELEECCYTDTLGVDLLKDIHLNDAYLLVDYVYLDGDERKRFAQVTHEYLIEQVQRIEYVSFNKNLNNFQLEFVNPCKELFWVYQRDDFIRNVDGLTECQFYNYTLNKYTDTLTCCCCNTDFAQCPIKTCTCDTLPQYLPTVALGQPVQITTPFNYIDRSTNTNQYTEGNPIVSTSMMLQGYQMGGNTLLNFPGNMTNYLYPLQYNTHTPADGINIYSFGINPESHQPSGSCNLGRIGDIELIIQFLADIQQNDLNGKFRVYTTSYNILRFMGGTCGVAFTYQANA